MSKNNFLAASPPFAVSDTITTLGRNLRTARIRRSITIAEAAARIGVGVRAVRDAEYGKTTTAISVYYALMWLYGILPESVGLADPDADVEGKRLDAIRRPQRASSGKGIDNDF